MKVQLVVQLITGKVELMVYAKTKPFTDLRLLNIQIAQLVGDNTEGSGLVEECHVVMVCFPELSSNDVKV